MEGIFVLLFAAWLMASLLTVVHAKDNNKTVLWGLIVLIFGIFGLVGYAISLASD